MIQFTWDRAKDISNRQKHGIGFETAQLVFDDPNHLAFIERITDGEERWQAIGAIPDAIVIVVVHTYRTDAGLEIIRIISARKATKQEKKHYAEKTL